MNTAQDSQQPDVDEDDEYNKQHIINKTPGEKLNPAHFTNEAQYAEIQKLFMTNFEMLSPHQVKTILVGQQKKLNEMMDRIQLRLAELQRSGKGELSDKELNRAILRHRMWQAVVNKKLESEYVQKSLSL